MRDIYMLLIDMVHFKVLGSDCTQIEDTCKLVGNATCSNTNICVCKTGFVDTGNDHCESGILDCISLYRYVNVI